MATDNLVPYRGFEDCRISSYDDTLWVPPDPFTEEAIEMGWAKLERERRKKGLSIWNSSLVRASELGVCDGVLMIGVQRTDYKSHVTTRDVDIGDENKGLGLFVESYVTTKDGCVLLGLDERLTGGEHRLNLPGSGGVEPEDIVVGEGLDQAFLREFYEETGMHEEWIDFMAPNFVVCEPVATHPGVVYTVRLELTGIRAFEMHEAYAKKQIDGGEEPEFSMLVPIPLRELPSQLSSGNLPLHNRARIVLEHVVREHAG